MKFSLDRLKNADWKQVGVNHGEKIALGGVGLLVVLILFMGTRWKTFDEKEPKDLIEGVKDQSAILAAAKWSDSEDPKAYTAVYDEEQDKYVVGYNVKDVYNNTYSVVQADSFKYPVGHSMIFALHRRQEPIDEPTWYPVEELIVTPGRFILQLPPDGEDPLMDGKLALGEEPGQSAGPMSKQDALLKQFEINNPQNGPGEGGGVGFENPGGVGGVPMPMEGMGDELAGDGGFEGGIEGEGMGETGVEINARGVRYNAVRGIYPFRRQLEAIMKARHDPTLSNFRRYVNLMDFEIQRQTAKPGPNPWSDKDADWDTLDQSIAIDLLEEANNYAEYVVDYSHIHYVITSPLPARLVGTWHPYFIGHDKDKIKTYTARQLELRRLLNEELVRMEKEAKEQDTDVPRGFARTQRDMGSLQEGVAGDSSQRRQLFNNMERSLNPDGEENFQIPSAELEGMLTSTSQTPEYILFRYMDFDVEPGKAYRYRVKLKLTNPNYGELADNLAAENVGTGKFRFTPWSDPSVPAIVTDDSKYFVTEAFPGSSRKEPFAKIDLYQWLNEIGTTANKIVSVQVGQIIGQPKPEIDEDKPMDVDEELLVDVLRPYQSFKGEPVELATRDAVVDLVTPPGGRRSDFHQDIGIREWKPVSQVLIVNEFGELENRNPIAQLQERALATKFLNAEYAPWEYLKHLGEEGEEMGDEGMGEIEGMGDLGDLYGRGSKSKRGSRGKSGRGAGRGMAPGGGRANPLRRNRGGA